MDQIIKIVDFHTHILPEMDDGSSDIETSNKLLNILEKDNIDIVCLTSHFYAFNESIDQYLLRRKEAFEKLNYHGNLELKLGSEVRYYHGISASDDLDKLLLEGTKFLLLELPFLEPITDSVIDEIIQLKNKGFKVVLAHIERYNLKNGVLDFLRERGILFQMNIDYINNLFSSHKALNMIKKHYISFLGSDCHNLTNRYPEYGKTLELLRRKLKVDDLSFYINGLYNVL